MRSDGSTSDFTITGDDVDDTGWEDLLEELANLQCGEGSLFSSLEDDGVTACEGRSQLPGHHESGEVPWDNLTNDTNGLVSGVCHLVIVNFDDLSVDWRLNNA